MFRETIQMSVNSVSSCLQNDGERITVQLGFNIGRGTHRPGHRCPLDALKALADQAAH